MAPAYTGPPRRQMMPARCSRMAWLATKTIWLLRSYHSSLILDMPTAVLKARAFLGVGLEGRVACWSGWGYLDLLVQIELLL